MMLDIQTLKEERFSLDHRRGIQSMVTSSKAEMLEDAWWGKLHNSRQPGKRKRSLKWGPRTHPDSHSPETHFQLAALRSATVSHELIN